MPFSFQISSGASQDRLEKLINERLQPGADKEKIDSRIWDLFGETWTVIFTDLSGFSRMVEQFGIIHFIQIIYESHRLLIPCIDSHDGILIRIEGDSMLIIFRKPSKAVECAINMQKILKEYNRNQTAEEKILLCVGIGYGKILKIADQDVWGAEVNAACKLGEDVAKEFEILITENIKNELTDINEISFEKLENIPAGVPASYKLIYKL